MTIEQNHSVTHTTASLLYTIPPTDGSKPYLSITNLSDKNFTQEEKKSVVTNLRSAPNASDLTLNTAGFQLYQDKSTFKNFDKEQEIIEQYYPLIVELIKEKTGGSRVQIYDHTIRRNRPGEDGSKPDRRTPVFNVHVDQTPKSAEARVHRHNPEDAEELLKKRYQLINVWRPIDNPAYDKPLAVCDFRSVDSKDLLPVSLIYPDYNGETYAVRYSPEHEWYYAKDMSEDEVLFIKCFDSEHFKDGSISGLSPHTAFVDPQTSSEAPLRNSIEIRTIVYYE
ncbi:hypothetical protein AKO1_010644 [Acrasis kona]|uniref:Methyltransferase n=1 Tax=Acrasis kona TaxID=1008807 RepID=A0AAW2ZIN6_9EUKA